MTRFKNLVSLAVVGLIAVAGGVFIAPAAAAHGGPIELSLTYDGGGGFQLFAHYEEDGHLVEAVMDPVVEAVASDGRTAGPVSLISSSQGQGRWVTSEPMLDEGDWSVTVSTTTPEQASQTIEITVTAPEEPPAPEPVDEPAEQSAEQVSAAAEAETTDDASQTAPDGDAASSLPVWAIVALAGVVVVGLGVLVWRKRSA